MTLDYRECVLSAYVETYDKRVAGARRLAARYIYAHDGITLECPYCGHQTIQDIWETWTIDTRHSNDSPLAPLEPQAPIEPREFDLKTCIVYVCSTCGRIQVSR